MRDETHFTILRVAEKAADFATRALLVFFATLLAFFALAAVIAAAFGGPFLWFEGTRLLDSDFLSALGALFLGLSGVYIGGRLRKFQETEARARANLALNVELRARAVAAGPNQVLEVVIEVHNVSRNTWFVPMAYLFVRSAVGKCESLPVQREHRNLARYPASLCQLQPDEKDQFFATLVFPVPDVPTPPAVIVDAEIVGTSERWLGPHKAKMTFIQFMRENEEARHDYYCIDRCEDESHPSYGKRVFTNRDGTTDWRASEIYRGLLDDVMLWSREAVVVLPDVDARAPQSSEAKGSTLQASVPT